MTEDEKWRHIVSANVSIPCAYIHYYIKKILAQTYTFLKTFLEVKSISSVQATLC